jgi:hypothetical protein
MTTPQGDTYGNIGKPGIAPDIKAFEAKSGRTDPENAAGSAGVPVGAKAADTGLPNSTPGAGEFAAARVCS